MSSTASHRHVVVLAAALASAAPLSAQNWVSAPRYFPELEQFGTPGEYGEFIAHGDVDGDGDEDLIAKVSVTGAGPTQRALRAFLNQGNGEFVHGPLSFTPTFYDDVGFGLRDVTADGVGDLVLRHASSPGPLPWIDVFPGLGGGAFGAPLTLASGGNGIAVAPGDSDADGDLDIALWHTGSGSALYSADWWRFDGLGFVPSASVVLTPDFNGPYVAGITAFDRDGDGDADIAVTQQTATNALELRVLETIHGNPVDGPAIDLGTTGSLAPRGADIDGDGDEDLLLIGFVSPSVAYQVVENVGGALQLGPLQLFSSSVEGVGAFVDLADWDGDGDLDVLTATGAPGSTTSSGVPALGLVRNSAGSFALAGHVPTYLDVRGAGAADFDGDGVLDWAAARALAFGRGLFDETLQVLPHFEFTQDFEALDWERDGDLDLVDLRGGFYVNDGNARLAAPEYPWPALPSPFSYRDAAGVADFDGDGWEDFVVGYFVTPVFVPIFLEMHLLRGSPSGVFTDVGPAAAPGVAIPLAPDAAESVVDLDGDGDLDLLRGAGLWQNSGSGSFAFVPLFGTAGAVDFGDADADGDADVLVQTSGTSLALERNQGGLAFTLEALTSGVASQSARFLDLDGDADDDVIADGLGPITYDGIVHLYPSLGASYGAPTLLQSQFKQTRLYAQDDVDGDGVLDLIGCARPQKGSSSATVLAPTDVWRGLGGGFAYEAPRAYGGPRAEGYADLDQDGDLEAFGSATMEVRRYDGPADGEIQQYGAGIAGTGGIAPIVGGSGPLRPGSTTAGLHLRRGPPLGVALFAVGTQQVELPGVPFAGFTTYVNPLLFLIAVPMGGTPSLPGSGSFDFDVSGLLPIVAGLQFTHQFAIADPASASGFSSTNGVAHRYGL